MSRLLPGDDVRPAGRLPGHVSHARRPERRKAVGGMLLSMALTSFLTGVTEPIEFTFMFLAPVLYRHARGAHRPRHGADGPAAACSSASASRPACSTTCSTSARRRGRCCCCRWALAYFALYYGLFRFFIVRFDLKTLGREADEAVARRAGSGRRSTAGSLGPPMSARSAAPPTCWRSTPARRACDCSSPTMPPSTRPR